MGHILFCLQSNYINTKYNLMFNRFVEFYNYTFLLLWL